MRVGEMFNRIYKFVNSGASVCHRCREEFDNDTHYKELYNGSGYSDTNLGCVGNICCHCFLHISSGKTKGWTLYNNYYICA